MVKVSKIFRKENVERFLDSEIEIEVDIDLDTNTIESVRVTGYNYHDRKLVDLTPVFDHFHEFANIVDTIDWAQEYSDYQTAQQEAREVLTDAA